MKLIRKKRSGQTIPESSVELQRNTVKEHLKKFKNACTLSLFCTIALIMAMAVYSAKVGQIKGSVLITLAGTPLLWLAGLFCQSCRMAIKELKKMPDDFLQNRLRTLEPEALAERLINNNAWLLSEHFNLLDEDEKEEIEEDRMRFPTPENTVGIQRKKTPSPRS